MADRPKTAGKRCQRCGYTLAGLPDAHVCPECGLEYDPYSVFIRLGGRSNAGQNAIVATVLAGWFLYLGISKRSIGEYIPCVLPLLILGWLSGWRWLRAVETGRTLTVGRSGIRFTHPDLKMEVIPWSRFGRAEISWITGRFCLRDPGGKKILVCRYYQLGSYLAMRDVVRQINHLAAVYSANIESPDRA